MADHGVRARGESGGLMATGARLLVGALALLALTALASTSRVGRGGTLEIPGSGAAALGRGGLADEIARRRQS